MNDKERAKVRKSFLKLKKSRDRNRNLEGKKMTIWEKELEMGNRAAEAADEGNSGKNHQWSSITTNNDYSKIWIFIFVGKTE